MSEPYDSEETPGATLTDDEIETHRVGGTSRSAASTVDDGDDSGDTGDDTGDPSDTSDTGNDSGDSTDTGDDSGTTA
jgi:penicillin-binding protein 1A